MGSEVTDFTPAWSVGPLCHKLNLLHDFCHCSEVFVFVARYLGRSPLPSSVKRLSVKQLWPVQQGVPLGTADEETHRRNPSNASLG